MNKKILASLIVIGILGLAVGWGAYSYFNDTETGENNTFTAGTLDLKVDNKDDPNIVYITLSNMKPGDDAGYYKWILKNVGTLPGKLSVTFSVITNSENGIEEPEQAAESQPYASSEG